MGGLTSEQVRRLREYLEGQGLTFEELKADMLDHICCDVETFMEQGLSFEASIERIKSQIPNNQFKKIQTETMEAIDKRIRITTILTYGSLGVLLLAAVFKSLRLAGAGQMLILSFVGMTIALISSVLTNPLIKEKKRGRAVLSAIVMLLIMFLTSLCFQLLQFPGAPFLRVTSITLSIGLLSVYGFYSYLNPQRASRHMVIQYVKKNGLGIEKLLIFLLALGTGLKFLKDDPTFVIFFVLLFVPGSIFYFISSWQYYFDDRATKGGKMALLFISIMALALFLLPAVNSIDYRVRVLMGWSGFTMISLAISVYYFVSSTDRQKLLLGFFSLLVAMFGFFSLTGEAGFKDPEVSPYLSLIYNPIVLFGLLAMFVLYFRRPVFRALLIMALGLFIFNYPVPGI